MKTCMHYPLNTQRVIVLLQKIMTNFMCSGSSYANSEIVTVLREALYSACAHAYNINEHASGILHGGPSSICFASISRVGRRSDEIQLIVSTAGNETDLVSRIPIDPADFIIHCCQ